MMEVSSQIRSVRRGGNLSGRVHREPTLPWDNTSVHRRTPRRRVHTCADACEKGVIAALPPSVGTKGIVATPTARGRCGAGKRRKGSGGTGGWRAIASVMQVPSRNADGGRRRSESLRRVLNMLANSKSRGHAAKKYPANFAIGLAVMTPCLIQRGLPPDTAVWIVARRCDALRIVNANGCPVTASRNVRAARRRGAGPPPPCPQPRALRQL
jgi:hypothetical protein